MKPLYFHQERALEQLPAGGGYLAFEQGLGKTLTAIAYANKHYYKRVVIVCPAVAIGVWENELLDSVDDGVLVPTGDRKEKAQQIVEYYRSFDKRFIVLNYEALLEPELEKAIKKWQPDLIIMDEAQKVKNATAKRSKVMHRLGAITHVLALSGTPVTKNLLDLYSQYKIIDPAIWGGISWTKFKQTYGIWGGYGGYELIGYNNVEDIKDKIRPYTVVARKEDTLDLPEKTFVRVPVRLSGRNWEDYKKMATEGVLGDWVTTTPMEKLLRLSQISGAANVTATAEFVRDLVSSGEQVVVYFRFRSEGRQLSEHLGVPDLNGSTPKGVRDAMVQEFQSGQNRIFLSQITAGSTAITLTAASHMVYHSMSYSYEDWAQSQDRIHRIGQYDPCTYYYIQAVGPNGGMLVDDLVLKAIEKKENVAAMVTQDPGLLLPKE